MKSRIGRIMFDINNLRSTNQGSLKKSKNVAESTKVVKSVPTTRIANMRYIETMMKRLKGVRPSASLAYF